MNVNLDLNKQAIKEYNNSTYEIPSYSKTEKAGAVRLDLSQDYTSNNVYGSHNKSIDDVKQLAENTDVATAQDYMTVLANTVSPEDYGKAMEDGYDLSDMSGEDAVNIVDHIKAVMAQSGQVIAGYNDDLNAEELTAITGSVSDANALKLKMEQADIPATDDNMKQVREAVAMMEGITELPEASIGYMVENNMEPTIENIYTSRYSVGDDGSHQARGYYAQDGSGYYARKADTINWEEMQPQLEKAVASMDLGDIQTEDAVDMGKWLLDKGIPVTESAIQTLDEINSVTLPVSDSYVENAAIRAIGQGKRASEANLSEDDKTDYEKAVDLLDRVSQVRNREETRLSMTLDASMRMIRKGIDVDTTELSDLVDQLKNEEEQIYREYFGEGTVEELEEKADIYDKTLETVRDIPTLPAATLGRIALTDSDYSLNNISSTGNAMKTSYEQAGQHYEELMTSPRRDMGDSIEKAFRNVGDILDDLGMDNSEENQRAVRILGYNSMDINKDEIERIKSVDSKVQSVVKGLTPAKTLNLIREGVNPLTADIDELVDKISEMDSDPERQNERYSRFLYKLEQSGEITDAERESYIGIYRMMNQLEQTGYAAVGSVAQSGVELTFGNLVTAMRSSRASIDAKIDDDFGLLTESVSYTGSLTDQIEAAFNEQLGDAAEELEARYQKEKLDDLRNVAGDHSEESVAELVSADLDASVNNIEAMEQFISYPNEFYRALQTFAGRLDSNRAYGREARARLNDAITSFQDSLDSKESAEESYDSLADTISDTLKDMTTYEAGSTIDLKTISLLHKQLGLSTELAAEENYHVPVMVGDKLTDVNVKLIHGDDTGLVTIDLDNEDLGQVRGEVRVNGDSLEAIFIGEDAGARDKLQSVADTFARGLTEEGYEDPDIRVIIGNPRSSNKYSVQNADNNSTGESTANLYKVAKTFIAAAQNQ